jgi:ribosomal-protein-alanine N-acetyltransferase
MRLTLQRFRRLWLTVAVCRCCHTGNAPARETSEQGLEVANREHALRTLSATVSDYNVASQKVLVKAGFVPIETAEVAGRTGMRYELTLESR